MPELPDVEVFRGYLQSTAMHQPIISVTVVEKAYRLFDDIDPEQFIDELTGRAFTETHRHGKHLLVATDGRWVALHFGMTGFLKYYKREATAPDHVRVRFDFTNGYRLAYDCQRLLGHVSLTDGPEAYIAEKELGPDALRISPDAFRERFARRRGMVKTALMDQSLIAGVGNVYADEVLYQAGFHPESKVPNLVDEQLQTLYSTMNAVLETTIDAGADPASFPNGFLTPMRRDGGAGTNCPHCGGEIEKTKVGGRTTYYCPRHQQQL